MKNEKGITLISLIVTIVLMIIISGVVTYSGLETIENSSKVTFISKMEMIQAKVNSIYEERKANIEKVNYYNTIGKELSEVDETKLNSAIGETSRVGFRYFDSIELSKLGLDDISEEVLINYDTREVISLTGIKIDGVIYYKLKDIPYYKGYNVEYNDKNTIAPTFKVEQTKVSTNEWRFTLKDIVYNGNVKSGTVSYKLHDDTNWLQNGERTNITVHKPGLYDIKLTDAAGNSTTVQEKIQTN